MPVSPSTQSARSLYLDRFLSYGEAFDANEKKIVAQIAKTAAENQPKRNELGAAKVALNRQARYNSKSSQSK